MLQVACCMLQSILPPPPPQKKKIHPLCDKISTSHMWRFSLIGNDFKAPVSTDAVGFTEIKAKTCTNTTLYCSLGSLEDFKSSFLNGLDLIFLLGFLSFFFYFTKSKPKLFLFQDCLSTTPF